MNYSFDVYVSWTRMFDPGADEIGLTKTVYSSSGIIKNSTISLAAEDLHGHVLNEIDMQNVGLHELGHSLGLRHSNSSVDIMYPTCALSRPVAELSTLDLYWSFCCLSVAFRFF
jgi:predicted Zn-dependent protease